MRGKSCRRLWVAKLAAWSDLKGLLRGLAALRFSYPRSFSDSLFRELHFQSQRVGEAVGQIGQTRQQVDVDDFRFREVLADSREVAVGDVVRRARQFFDIDEGNPFFFAVARIVSGLERRPVFCGQPYSLRSEEHTSELQSLRHLV